MHAKVYEDSFSNRDKAGRQLQGRSRPFPPKAVLGPAFMPGWGLDRRGALSAAFTRLPGGWPQEPGEPG
jgi:hypothetical protein